MKLKFDKHDKAFISEVFGMDQKSFTAVANSMLDFFKQMAEADNVHMTKTEMLERYLLSPEFKDQNYPLETANQYFILGYMFRGALDILKPKMGDMMDILHSMIHDHGEAEIDDKKSDKEERLPN